MVYTGLKRRHDASVEEKGYWGTQFYGTKAERQALWSTSSIDEAKAVLDELPDAIREEWMRTRFGGRTEIPLHAFFKPRQESIRSGSISRPIARQLEAIEAAFDEVPGGRVSYDRQNPCQAPIGEEFPDFLKPIMSLYLTEIACFMSKNGGHGIELDSVSDAPTKEAMFMRVKGIYERHVPSAAELGKYFELETDLFRTAGPYWKTHVPEAPEAPEVEVAVEVDGEEDVAVVVDHPLAWLRERKAKQTEIMNALMLMDLDFARQG